MKVFDRKFILLEITFILKNPVLNQNFQYYFEHFPAEHFSLLYLLNTIFCGFANYTTNPIFSFWIVDGENTGQYNFKEGESDKDNSKASKIHSVNLVLGVVWTVTNISFIAYHVIYSLPAKAKRNMQRETQKVLSKESFEAPDLEPIKDGMSTSKSIQVHKNQNLLNLDHLCKIRFTVKTQTLIWQYVTR